MVKGKASKKAEPKVTDTKEGKKEIVLDNEDDGVTDETVLVNTVKDSSLGIDAKPKKKKLKLIITTVVIVALLIAGGIGCIAIRKNPTSVFKSVINARYKDFSKSLDELNDSLKDMEKRMDADKQIIDMKVSFKDGVFEDLEDTTINARFGVDRDAKAMELNASIKNDGKSVIDGTGFIKDDGLYIKSDALLDGTYLVKDDLDDMLSEDLGFSLKDSSMDDLLEALTDEIKENDDSEETRILLDVLDNMNGKKLTEIVDTKLIDKIAKDGKNALIKSLDKDNMEKNSETIDINDKSVKTNKYTYTLNEAAVKDLMSNFSKNVKDDKDMISNISKLTGIDKSDIKDLIDELGDKDNYEGIGKGGELSIYTTTVLSNPIKYEFTAGKTTISYSEYKDNYYILFEVKDADVKIEIIGTPKGKETEVKGKYKIGKEEATFLKGTVTSWDSKKIEYDLTLILDDFEINVSEKSDKKGGKAKIDFNGYFDITTETKIEKDEITTSTSINLDIDEDEIVDFIKLINEVIDEDISIKDIKKSLGLDELELKGSIIVDVTYTNSGDIADYDIDDAKDIDDIDIDEVQEKLEDILEDYEEFASIFENMDLDDLTGGMLTPGYVADVPSRVPYDDDDDDIDDVDTTNIYDDKKCWDAYTSDFDYDGLYREYYEEYCKN